MISATETGASSVQRGTLTKMRPSLDTATPVLALERGSTAYALDDSCLVPLVLATVK